MSRENTSGLGVNKLYGATDQGTGGGVLNTYGDENKVCFQFGEDAEVGSEYVVPLVQKSILMGEDLFFDSTGQVPVTEFEVQIRAQSNGQVLATQTFTPLGTVGSIALTTLAGDFAGGAGLEFVFIPNTKVDVSLYGKVSLPFRNLTADFGV